MGTLFTFLYWVSLAGVIVFCLLFLIAASNNVVGYAWKAAYGVFGSFIVKLISAVALVALGTFHPINLLTAFMDCLLIVMWWYIAKKNKQNNK